MAGYLQHGSQGAIDGRRIREGLLQVGIEKDSLGILLRDAGVLSTHSFGEVKVRTFREGIEFNLLHILCALSQLRGAPR